MDLLTVFAILAALVLAATLAVWWMRRRAAFRSALAQRGWQSVRSGDETTVVPTSGDWTITTSRSFAAQMSPPSTRVVVSTWTSPIPRTPGPAMVAGPAPPPELRDLTVALLGSATPAMTRWLGIDRVSGGRPLVPLSEVDDRLLAFATDGYRPAGQLTGVADAISAWCSVNRSEREQPAVSIDDTGICVRVRVDVLRSVQQIDAFVELGLRCRDSLGPPVA
jgi:hypothetical protein